MKLSMGEKQEVKSNLELEVSVVDILLLVVDKWKVLALFGFLSGVTGVFYSLSLPEIYSANVLMSQADENAQISTSGIPDLVGGAMGGFPGLSLGRNSLSLEQGLALLKSRRFAEQFIEAENLLPSYLLKTGTKNSWLSNEPPTRWRAYREFGGLMSTSVGAEGLITLTFEFTDPELVAKIANSIVAYANEMMRKEAIEEAQSSILFLETELKKTNLINSQTILYSLIEQQTEKIMIASVRDQYSFKVIDPAIKPDERISPNRRNVVMFFTFIGVFVGLCAVARVCPASQRLFRENWQRRKASCSKKENV